MHAAQLSTNQLRAEVKRLKDLASKTNSHAALMARALKKRLKEERK